MRWQDRQNQIEELVYDAINELSEQLGVNVPFYPAVFWIGRTLEFEDTGLPKTRRLSFEWKRSHKESYFLPPNTILINSGCNLEALLEEASHFVHFTVSGVKFSGKKPLREAICLRVIAEMLGLLGARMLGSHEKNNFEIVPDLAYLPWESWDDFIDGCPDLITCFEDLCEFYASQQGYGLADRVYYQYLSGQVSRKFIRTLFLNHLAEENAATKKFLRLKTKFWPPQRRIV
ncbi:MAG: hypothetical protein WCT16_03930 [Candidatus Buchananbacteria bacterium]